eukprot:4426116-Alexandrium_andersonii.AAC.1
MAPLEHHLATALVREPRARVADGAALGVTLHAETRAGGHGLVRAHAALAALFRRRCENVLALHAGRAPLLGHLQRRRVAGVERVLLVARV